MFQNTQKISVCHPIIQTANIIHHYHNLKQLEANTESCEQGFRRLNMYFHLTRKRHDLSEMYSSGLLMNALTVIWRRI